MFIIAWSEDFVRMIQTKEHAWGGWYGAIFVNCLLGNNLLNCSRCGQTNTKYDYLITTKAGWEYFSLIASVNQWRDSSKPYIFRGIFKTKSNYNSRRSNDIQTLGFSGSFYFILRQSFCRELSHAPANRKVLSQSVLIFFMLAKTTWEISSSLDNVRDLSFDNREYYRVQNLESIG